MAYNNVLNDATGHAPFFLLYGRRASLPISRILGEDSLLDPCLQLVADAMKQASAATTDASRYNRERLQRRANTDNLQPGDAVAIRANEPLSMISTWDTQWTVTKVNGKVILIVHQQTGQQKRLNINKLKLVDPNIVWDEVRPHPTRKTGRPSMTVGTNVDLQHTLPTPAPPSVSLHLHQLDTPQHDAPGLQNSKLQVNDPGYTCNSQRTHKKVTSVRSSHEL